SVRGEPPPFDVRLVLTDQPLLSVPGTAAAFARDALDAAPFAHVLCAKRGELFFWPDLDVIVLAFFRCPRLRSSPAFGFRPRAFSRRHALPRRLRLLDVLPGRIPLFRCSHIASLLFLFSLGRKQGATVGIADC